MIETVPQTTIEAMLLLRQAMAEQGVNIEGVTLVLNDHWDMIRLFGSPVKEAQVCGIWVTSADIEERDA